MNLLKRLGLTDSDGNLSFNKLISLGVLALMVYSVVWSTLVLKTMPGAEVWGFCAALLGGGFVLKGKISGDEVKQVKAMLNNSEPIKPESTLPNARTDNESGS